MSTGSIEAAEGAELADECEALEATDAVCARRAVNSRVRRLTWNCVQQMAHARECVRLSRHTTASCSFSHSAYTSAGVMGRGCRSGRPPPDDIWS